MNLMECKSWILQNGFDSKGRLLSGSMDTVVIQLTQYLHPDTITPIRKKYILNEWYQKRKCPICGNDIDDINKLKIVCSYRCSAFLRLSNPISVEKTKNTNIQRYGSKYPLQSQEIRDIIKNNNKKKYGKEFVHQTIKSKINYYGEEIYRLLNDKKWLLKQYETKDTYEIAKEMNIGHTTVIRYMEHHNIRRDKHYYVSKGEKEVRDYINSIYNGKMVLNNKTVIYPYEIDIFLPDLNIAIEYNGDYFHKEGEMKPVGYHQMKTALCESHNIKLIHIWEKDWKNNNSTIKELLRREI